MRCASAAILGKVPGTDADEGGDWVAQGFRVKLQLPGADHAGVLQLLQTLPHGGRGHTDASRQFGQVHAWVRAEAAEQLHVALVQQEFRDLKGHKRISLRIGKTTHHSTFDPVFIAGGAPANLRLWQTVLRRGSRGGFFDFACGRLRRHSIRRADGTLAGSARTNPTRTPVGLSTDWCHG